MKLLITFMDTDSSDHELATVRQLIEVELEKCFICEKTYKETKHLPFHCNNCTTLRNERWLHDLINKSRSFSISLTGIPHVR